MVDLSVNGCLDEKKIVMPPLPLSQKHYVLSLSVRPSACSSRQMSLETAEIICFWLRRECLRLIVASKAEAYSPRYILSRIQDRCD